MRLGAAKCVCLLHRILQRFTEVLGGDLEVMLYGSFVPLFDYLFHNRKPGEANRVLMRAYYYKSQLFNWYGAQTDNIINAMHSRVSQALPAGFPIMSILDYFRDSRKADTELTLGHLLNMRLRFIILNLIYVERFGGSPFNVCFKGNEPHVDHIYPQSPLKRMLGLLTEEVNHIGNYVRFALRVGNTFCISDKGLLTTFRPL